MKKIINLVKKNYLLILILSLFFFSRIFRIETIPQSLYWDEASIGYNAYSVLKTGKDEWGEFLPLHFRAFGEFKLPVYIYAVAVSEAFLGLSILAVRLPAVIFGLFSVLGLYLLVLKLTKNKTISLFSSFLFTITPWFFIFSRTGYEAVAGLAFFIYAIYFLLLSKKKKWMMLVSVVLFILSFYSYNSFRILTPLILGPYFLISGVNIIKKRSKKEGLALLLSIFLLLLSSLPIYKLYSKDSGLGRLQTVGTSKNLVSNYLSHFSPNFLFVSGDINPRSQMPGSSQLYSISAVFILLGLVYIIKHSGINTVKKKDPKYLWFIYLLLIAPLPAAITRESPHALRAILLAPVFATISSMGVYYLSGFFKKNKKIVLGSIIIFYALSFEGYFYKFGTEYNNLSSGAWQNQYKLVMEKYGEDFGDYYKVYIHDDLAQPYIFTLFYNQIDPQEFLDSKVLNDVSDWGFSTVKSFGNFEFIKKCDGEFEKNSLVICPIKK